MLDYSGLLMCHRLKNSSLNLQDGVRHRKRIVPERSWGLWHAEQNWNSLDDDVSANDISAPRADAAAPRGGRLIAKSGNAVA